MLPSSSSVIEALKQGKVFKAYNAEADYWRSWQFSDDDEVVSYRGWGKVCHEALFCDFSLAAYEILTHIKSNKFKTN
jgi:hypothetical protein